MKPLTSVRKYHYWSERLAAELLQDNVARLPNKVNLNFGGTHMGIQVEASDAPDTRAAKAATVEQLLADHIVTDFDYTGPLDYIASSSPMVLSSLRNPEATDSGAVILFADLRSPEGKRVAVCLFGSAANVCGCDPDPPLWRRFGWTSSTNEGVQLLLRAGAHAEDSYAPAKFWHHIAAKEHADSEDICSNAVNICIGQGQYDHDIRPWHRGYTIGYYRNVEWLAQIYFSTSGGDPARFFHFDTVFVGAAFWVRSGSPRAWVPYTPKRIVQLDTAQHSLLSRPFVRLRYSCHGKHLLHVHNPGADYYGPGFALTQETHAKSEVQTNSPANDSLEDDET